MNDVFIQESTKKKINNNNHVEGMLMLFWIHLLSYNYTSFDCLKRKNMNLLNLCNKGGQHKTFLFNKKKKW